MSTLESAVSGAEITTDPGLTLLVYLADEWTETTPTLTDANFGRNFKNMALPNLVILKGPFNPTVPAQILGSKRYRRTLPYKLHVYSRGPDAMSLRFAMEQELKRIIQADVGGLVSEGFDLVELTSDFNEIVVHTDSMISDSETDDDAFVARSAADLTITYDEVVVSA